LDVFITQTIAPVQACIEGNLGQQGFKALLANCELQRADCYAVLRGQSRDVQRFLLRLAHWMNGPYWRDACSGAPDMIVFVARRLQPLARSYQKSARDLHTLDVAQLHILRIKAKKLRYSAEFFASLYHDKLTKSYLAALSEVQERLGHINDIRVADRLLNELAVNLPEHREVIAFIKTRIDADLPVHFKALHQCVKNFARQPAFWEK
jgi:CHAD domain-containing protein